MERTETRTETRDGRTFRVTVLPPDPKTRPEAARDRAEAARRRPRSRPFQAMLGGFRRPGYLDGGEYGVTT